jgi:hypothetical protein
VRSSQDRFGRFWIFAVFGLKLPEPAARAVQIAATASIPVALLHASGWLGA